MRKVFLPVLTFFLFDTKSFAEYDRYDHYPKVDQWICDDGYEMRVVEVESHFLKNYSCGVTYQIDGRTLRLFKGQPDRRQCQLFARDFAERLEEDSNFLCVGRGDHERLPHRRARRE